MYICIQEGHYCFKSSTRIFRDMTDNFFHRAIFFSKNSENATIRRLSLTSLQRSWSAWSDSLLLSARSVIRFLLERNISYRHSRCVDSLIRGDKYRRDTSPKQTTRTVDRWRWESETNGSEREREARGQVTEGTNAVSILAFGETHRRERHPLLPRGVHGVIVCRVPANPVSRLDPLD